LFKNSSNGEEKKNLPMLEEFTSGTLARRVAQSRKVYNIKDKFQLKLRRRKIQIEFNESKWKLERWVFAAH
jgi:hypothetical protein